MDKSTVYGAFARAAEYIDSLTVDSPVNVPGRVVRDTGSFFTWDNERRSPAGEPYLFDWSYYNGVVMEGLWDLAQASPAEGGKYLDYIRGYFDAMIAADEGGTYRLIPELAGYVDRHGADCYKTAALLTRLAPESREYMDVCRELYLDLTDTRRRNSAGHVIPLEYSEEELGGNYWHTWAKPRPPRYKVWLDGIYMLQPFLARFAALTDDGGELERVDRRLTWVAEKLLSPNGLYYHAGSSARDVCPFFWTRAMGWYGMAMADVMEVLPEAYIPRRREALETFARGVVKYQKPCGVWTNLADLTESGTNRPEVSGTAMITYALLKGARMGWLGSEYRESALRAFTAMTRLKLIDGQLRDIYFKASANGENNYEKPEYYLTDEGKGVGPFIMACSEVMYLI